ncbi:S-layer homology domain-containing protein [Pontibacillus marinus]|uniref:SLH domain-containing protein n=1 Tax=Pontibacillus marinus BH030004 = DSM 16465 TaxID=1385511 RepID=A0A0A5I5E2_9BACI|nr:S-layer homology domain-containing protein [Pontibacillus marinus]KGX91027.1 hypothetical protein N783_13395 [Pontibacillus marinus BH030004 = DSM 16465]
MAFQPKSYRKFMVASASAALVGSAVAPAVSAATAAEDFSDVTEDTRHYEHINALYDMGVVSGYTDGTFGPDNNLKRSEAAEMIFTARGFNVDADYELTLTGVPDRIDGIVAELEEHGIFEGNAEGEFNADVELTRSQMAKVVVEAFDLMPEGEVEESDFSDRGETSLNTYVDVVAQLGIADGYTDGSFGVHDSILRKDFSKMLHNAWKLWNEENSSVTVNEVGTVTNLVTGVYSVSLPLENLDGATTDSEVTLDVDGETVTLEYLADEEAFYNGNVQGYTEAELKDAEVIYDVEDDTEEPSEPSDLGTAEDLGGEALKLVPGVYTLSIPAENVDVADDATLSVTIDGKTKELEYLAEEDVYFTDVNADSEEAVLSGSVSAN